MRSKPANFILNHQNVENPSFFLQKNTSTHSHNTVEHTKDIAWVHMSLSTPNDIVLQLPTPTMASSSTQPQESIRHEKSVLSHVYFDLKSHRESPVPTTVITGPEICSTSAKFMEDDQKVKKTPVFNQKYSESANTPILEHFNWADDAWEFPTSLTLPETSPTKACLIQNQPKFHKSTSLGQNHLKPCVAADSV